MNIDPFISKDKTLLEAPAGYGKTYILAECITKTPDNEIQLILTHTHAGIASIKEKIKRFNISKNKFHLETISGFAQKYVLAFHCHTIITKINENSTKYFSFIIKRARELFQSVPIKRTIKYSYHGLFVDEYQDCTISQHKMLMALAETLPIHILGDPLQGIYGFKEKLVDFDNDLQEFFKVGILDTPWRWNRNGNNQILGCALEKIRKALLSDDKKINLVSFSRAIKCIKIKESDINNRQSDYRRILNDLITNPKRKPYLNSLLLIFPEYKENNIPKGNVTDRARLKSQIDYSDQLTLLEAIDEKSFYSIAKNVDDIIKNINRKTKKIKTLNNHIFLKLFNKGNLNGWIKGDRLISKRGDGNFAKKELERKLDLFMESPSISYLLKILLFMKNEMKFKTKRNDLLKSILKSMKIASLENKSVYDSMVSHKNIVRRIGRKVYGKCLGTTLLTKGLEFDTVVILNAHRLDDLKHFYVAITRACKKLLIFSEKESLDFN